MTSATAPARWVKDPADVGSWRFEWDDWLDPGETITTATVEVDAGLTKLADTIDGDGRHVTFRLSGGTVSTTGSPTRVGVTCTVTTSAGNTWQATKHITIIERET